MDFLIELFKSNLSKTAVIYNDKEYTYEDMINSYNKSLNYLQSNIPSNSVISLHADFNPYSIGMLLALIKHNCIIVPLSDNVKNIDLLTNIAECEYCIDFNEDNYLLYNRNIKVKNELLLKLKDINHSGLVLFSSGTTGQPKGSIHDLVLLMDKFKKQGKSFKTITFLLFDHIGGFNTLFYCLSNVSTIMVVNKRISEEVCRIIEKYKVELLPTSPSFLNIILISKCYEKYDLSSLKLITYGTEPMPETTLKQLNSLFPNIQLKQTYGLSELGIMSSKSESSDSLWIKVGGSDFKTKIVDGILYIKSKNAMLGYLNAPSPFDEDGWFNTQDKVEEKDGYIKFLGRITDIINVGGQKVYPIEVESVLLEIKGIKDVSVYGEKHSLLGQIVVADIILEDDTNIDINEVKKYCRGKLDKHKIPIKINIINFNLVNERFKKIRK